MKAITKIAAISALALSMSAGFAVAEECVDTNTTASTTQPADTGAAATDTANQIAKDGSRAPLEGAQTSAEHQAVTDAPAPDAADSTQTANRPGEASDSQSSDTQASADTVQTDGSNMPLQSSDSDKSGADIATSQQDVEAQQEGEQTMAAKADKDC
jgi:hypothetical protein